MNTVIGKEEKIVALLHIENSDKKGNVYFQGEPEDLGLAILSAMQTSEFLTEVFKQAVLIYDVAKKRGLDIASNPEYFKSDKAEDLLQELMNKAK